VKVEVSECGMWNAHFFAAFGVEEDPTQLNDLCRILGDVDAVFIAGGCHMNYYVAV
jgi:hypothetical protein